MIAILGSIGLNSPLVAFALAHFVYAASPGPDFFVISGIAATSSRNRALAATAGTCCSVAVWACVAAIGLASLVEAAPSAATGVKYAGAVYIIWLGVAMLRAGFRRQTAPETTTMPDSRLELTAVRAFRRGFLVGFSNPITLAYYTSAFSLVVPQQSSAMTTLRIAGIAVLVSGMWFCAVAVLFSLDLVQRRILRAQRALDLAAGIAFTAFGASFALG